MNPIQMIHAMRTGNPQSVIMGILRQQNNPMAQNMMQMVQNNDLSGIEQFGRNIAKERNIDFDKALSDFKSQFSIK